ncbi:hypothetical protein TNCV_4881151 [Trichonephila clavipes]|nr:hypothetical protein TNCV_4881151 [Trichonephila clavipes]
MQFQLRWINRIGTDEYLAHYVPPLEYWWPWGRYLVVVRDTSNPSGRNMFIEVISPVVQSVWWNTVYLENVVLQLLHQPKSLTYPKE